MLIRLSFACILFLTACTPEEKMEIVFGGDLMLDRGVKTEMNRKGLSYLLDDIAPVFKSSDFAFVNLECPIDSIATPLTKQFVFLGDPAALPELKDAGITHGNMANNHSYDHGREALVNTANNLIVNDLTPVGYGVTQKNACAPLVLKKGDIEVAVFASVTLGLEAWMYLEDQPGMCQATANDLQEAIKAYKRSNPVGIVIVTLHWGAEYQSVPTSVQRRQARSMIEAGADVIIGHHPHVVQSFESINGKAVYYSIGNLLFDNQNPMTHDGILVKVRVDRSKKVSTQIIPYHAENCKPLLMAGKQKREFLDELQKRSDVLPD